MKDFRSQFRLPTDLADRLKVEAEKNNRSMNAEIVARLEKSFEGQLDRIEWKVDILVKDILGH